MVTGIWNNKDIRINGKSVLYKTYFDSGIYTVSDLSLHLNNVESFNAIRHKMNKGNFVTWTGLRHSIPPNLKISQGKFTRGNSSLLGRIQVFTTGGSIKGRAGGILPRKILEIVVLGNAISGILRQSQRVLMLKFHYFRIKI